MVAMISRYRAARQWALERLSQRLGPLADCSTVQPFEASGYYDRQMGEALEKQFVRFQPLADPVELAEWKIWTNALEDEFAAGPARDLLPAGEPRPERPLNLDPGYVTEAKLVLATTKDRDHRIYLSRGIYAEVTLSYTGRRWHAHRWTYPDYRTEAAIEFVEACRQHLRENLPERLPGYRRPVLKD